MAILRGVASTKDQRNCIFDRLRHGSRLGEQATDSLRASRKTTGNLMEDLRWRSGSKWRRRQDVARRKTKRTNIKTFLFVPRGGGARSRPVMGPSAVPGVKFQAQRPRLPRESSFR